MNLSAEDRSLVVAARRGEPGALRALARSLDDGLAEEDAPLDGAVLAWRSVSAPGLRGGGGARAGLRGQLTRIVRATTASRRWPSRPVATEVEARPVVQRTLTGRRPAA